MSTGATAMLIAGFTNRSRRLVASEGIPEAIKGAAGVLAGEMKNA
jgi:hypothetical protein